MPTKHQREPYELQSHFKCENGCVCVCVSAAGLNPNQLSRGSAQQPTSSHPTIIRRQTNRTNLHRSGCSPNEFLTLRFYTVCRLWSDLRCRPSSNLAKRRRRERHLQHLRRAAGRLILTTRADKAGRVGAPATDSINRIYK